MMIFNMIYTYFNNCVGTNPLYDLLLKNDESYHVDESDFMIKIIRLLLIYNYRFSSSHDPQKLISLDDYISRMKED